MSDIFDSIYGLEEFKNAYQGWLRDILEIDTRYNVLFDQLYDMPFRYILENDGNRESDARHLREEFAYRANLTFRDEWIGWGASVLEVLAALSFQMENSVCEFPDGDFTPAIAFWIMLENLGLDWFTDDVYFVENGFQGFDKTRRQVEKIVDRWLDRRFTKTGKGSPWPRKYGVEDQRNVEMWYQLSGFVIDNGWV